MEQIWTCDIQCPAVMPSSPFGKILTTRCWRRTASSCGFQLADYQSLGGLDCLGDVSQAEQILFTWTNGTKLDKTLFRGQVSKSLNGALWQLSCKLTGFVLSYHTYVIKAHLHV